MTVLEGLIPGTWTIDPTHTEVRFSVRHLAISKVRGRFEQFTGAVVVGEQLEESSVEAAVEVASVNTNQTARDEHLRTSDFFKADEFPKMKFRSTGVRVEGDRIVVTGDLTIRGVTKPVDFDVEFGGTAEYGFGHRKAGFEAVTTINRHDFGVSWNAVTEAGGLTLGDDVTITIDAQIELQA